MRLKLPVYNLKLWRFRLFSLAIGASHCMDSVPIQSDTAAQQVAVYASLVQSELVRSRECALHRNGSQSAQYIPKGLRRLRPRQLTAGGGNWHWLR